MQQRKKSGKINIIQSIRRVISSDIGKIVCGDLIHLHNIWDVFRGSSIDISICQNIKIIVYCIQNLKNRRDESCHL